MGQRTYISKEGVEFFLTIGDRHEYAFYRALWNFQALGACW